MMLYRNVLNFLRGSVQVEIECACPERVLNLCAVEEIAFWDLQWLSPIALRLRVTRRGWRALREVCTRADAQASRLRERGAPQLLLRLRTRYALLAALALFVFLGAVMSGYLNSDATPRQKYQISVIVYETVPTETILRALEKCGVAVGSQGLKIHQEDVRNRALLELPDVAWLAVNVRGCVAHVQVVERKRPPAVVQESQVCNVVARREGLVTRVQALDGKAVAAPGSVVTEGELLISGVADSERSGLRLLHGMGEVWARTWYDLSVSVPLKTTEKTGEGRKKLHLSLDFGRRRIKFYGKGSITGVDCDKITYYKPFTLPGGLRLPLTLVRERITAWEGSAAERTEQSARQEGEQQLLALLSARLPEGSTVTDTRFAAVRQGDRLTVVLKAECLEQIGQTVTLPETETTQR